MRKHSQEGVNYLDQVALLDAKIRIQQDFIDDLIFKIAYVTDDAKILKYIHLAESNNNKISEYSATRNKIIAQISGMENKKYSSILAMRYVLGMSIKEISEKMCYTYDYLAELHERALNEFQNCYMN